MRKKLILSVLFFAFIAPSFSAEGGVVLALSGGGTRGFAHIGVIEVLEEQGIPVVGIVGTSIGSLIGALKASGYDAKAMRRAIEELDLPSLLSENSPPMFSLTGNTRKNSRQINTVPTLSYRRKGNQSGPLGILEGDRLFEHFRLLLRNLEVADFNRLPIPFAAIATDLRTGDKIVLRSGSLASAMRASMSIPGLFEPWEINGRLLVDGGLVSNLPVETAKELFPGFPVIAIDVSDYPTEDRRISNFIDVIDQSLTIVMRRTTVQEAALADIIITPQVREFSFLDNTVAPKIIQRGRDAVLPQIEKIKELSSLASVDFLPLASNPPGPILVGDVQIQGLPKNITQQLRKRYLRWVGKPLDHAEVEQSLEQLMLTSDILTVDYRLEALDGEKYTLILDVRKRPDIEIGLSGYTTNLNPNRWVFLKGVARGLFSEMDSLRATIYAGQQWGIDLSYLTAPEPLNAWEVLLSARNRKMETNMGKREWDRYAAGAVYHMRLGELDMGLGLAYEYVDGKEGYANSWGPTLSFSYDTLDMPSDPTTGQVWRFNLWWPNAEEVLYRFTYFKPVKVGELWRTYVRVGYAEGNINKQGHAAYLGAAEELYSISGKPIEAERMVWANIAFRRVLKRSVFGIVATEVFGSYGYAMDKDYEKIAAPWEVGMSVSIPNNLINLKLAAMYGSEEFKLGFFLGVPIWSMYPLP